MHEAMSTVAKEGWAHLRELFGVSWDRLLFHGLCGLTHLWFVWAVMGTPHQHMNSPLDGLAVLLRSLGIPLPAWIADVSTWLGAPERAGLITLAAIGAGIAAIISARTRKSGPGIACVLLTLVAVQGGGSAVLVQTAVTIAAPWLAAVVLALLPQSPRSPSALGPQFHLPTTSTRLFSALGIYLEIAFASVLALAGLIYCFSTPERDPSDEATELSLTATDRLLDGTPDDKRAAHQALIVAGALLANKSEPRARSEHTERLRFRLTGPTGAAPLPGKLRRAGDLTPDQREAILMTARARAEARD